jgi:hypothetical protein
MIRSYFAAPKRLPIEALSNAAMLNRTTWEGRQRSLFATLVTLLDRINDEAARQADVIRWGSPVPAFGDPAASRVATLGLNPSNREFVDAEGVELGGDSRRFHTLASLGLLTWDEAGTDHLNRMLAACRNYFSGNPYDRWFRRLDLVVSATGSSFYDPASPACHLDLIPYATARKWTALSSHERSGLLRLVGDTLGILLRRSAIRVLVLNGRSVISYFQEATGIMLECTEMPGWALPRHSVADVKGYAYQGRTNTVLGCPLPQELLVLGFNHNLQSSYGVSTSVIEGIRSWVGDVSKQALRTRAVVAS